jgi:acetyl esterase/lipase
LHIFFGTTPRMLPSSRHASSTTQALAAALTLLLPQPRQRLDMYIPKCVAKGDSLPTVIFVTGGAWTIGYKAWGALLARRLCDSGVITMCLDYRNFPQVKQPGRRCSWSA